MPPFGFEDPLTRKSWQRDYSDDPSKLWIRQVPISAEERRALPKDGLLGADAVVVLLHGLLREE
jgi:hypothetical protein